VAIVGRKIEKLNINTVTFKYSGTENDLTLFLKTIIYDHLVKNNIIVDKPIKDAPFLTNK
jgi:hypothetical protein